MYKLWQKKLKLKFSNNVFDIVQFGSSTLDDSNPSDIDIAVIYQKIPLKTQLNESQLIKKQLKLLTNLDIHIKSYDLYTLLDPSNFAKQGILFNGISLLDKKPLANKFELYPFLYIEYDLSNLLKKDKVRFHYMLKGKGKFKGLLQKNKGELVKPGLIKINPQNKLVFEKSISLFNINFKMKTIFES
jgi:predicted nucleotidyltransferase